MASRSRRRVPRLLLLCACLGASRPRPERGLGGPRAPARRGAEPSPAFFDFFGKPSAGPEERRADDARGPAAATYGQLKALKLLRASLDVDQRWATYCSDSNLSAVGEAEDSDSNLSAAFVKQFLVDPANHQSQFLKQFLEHAKLDPVRVPRDIDDDDEDLGGFMDSNSFGLVKSEKWLKEEKRLLAVKISRFKASGPEELGTWERFCERMQDWEDPDDEESQAVRNEMGMREGLGQRKTALESWLDAAQGKVPRTGNKWGS